MERFTSPGLNDFRAYRPYRDHGLFGPSSRSGFQYAGLTCFVITVTKPSQFMVGYSLPLPLISLDSFDGYMVGA